ncbi:hypothetical protein D3C78_1358650 [compost metagenome]
MKINETLELAQKNIYWSDYFGEEFAEYNLIDEVKNDNEFQEFLEQRNMYIDTSTFMIYYFFKE